jgi:hypothetical protein
MDRLARNLDELRRTVQLLTKKGVSISSISPDALSTYELARQEVSHAWQLPLACRILYSREGCWFYEALLLANGEKVRICLPSRASPIQVPLNSYLN